MSKDIPTLKNGRPSISCQFWTRDLWRGDKTDKLLERMNLIFSQEPYVPRKVSFCPFQVFLYWWSAVSIFEVLLQSCLQYILYLSLNWIQMLRSVANFKLGFSKKLEIELRLPQISLPKRRSKRWPSYSLSDQPSSSLNWALVESLSLLFPFPASCAEIGDVG